MDFMNCINMVPDWVACFWCLIAGWSACHAVWCIRTRHSKSERTSGRDVVVIVGRLAISDVADPTPPVGNGADKRAPSNDDGHDRGKQGGNKANDVTGMSTVENGGDCREFMRSQKLGRIAFYQGNDSEGFLHIKNNPDPNHQIMLKDGNIPNTLAYGKFYADTYQKFSGWSVVNGDKCVFLGKDGDGVKIITAYASSTKAAVFKGRVALENEEEVQAS